MTDQNNASHQGEKDYDLPGTVLQSSTFCRKIIEDEYSAGRLFTS
jgi:hypothetical protein